MNSELDFVRITRGLNDPGVLCPVDDYKKFIDRSRDCYRSLYYYTKEHYDLFATRRSIAGITDVITDRLVFDFDNEENRMLALEDTKVLCSRLLDYGIPRDKIQVTFSGNKGFGVELRLNKRLTPKEMKPLCNALAGDLLSLDKTLYNASRIIREPLTKHNVTEFYKYPMTLDGFFSSTLDEIEREAREPDLNISYELDEVILPEELLTLTRKHSVKAGEAKHNISIDFDISKKPTWLSSCKYALQMGHYKNGERSNSLIRLAATYKNQGFPKEAVYHLLKSVQERAFVINQTDKLTKDELWLTIVEQVFSDLWNNGQFSCKDDEFLQDKCKALDLKCSKFKESNILSMDNLLKDFKSFAQNIEKNTIRTGIKELDKNLRLTTSMLVGLLAAPSVGKTTQAMRILKNVSKNGESGLYFSLDMGKPLITTRMIQIDTGVKSDTLYSYFQNNDVEKLTSLSSKVQESYKNVRVVCESGYTIEDIDSIIKQEKLDKPNLKLVVIDYLECIRTSYSDATASSGLAASRLKEIANRYEICIIVLLQPQKSAGDGRFPLTSMRKVKGASVIEQDCRAIVTMWKPGFDPRNPDQDRYFKIAIVKNNMGTIGSFSYGIVDHVTGELRNLNDEEFEELDAIEQRNEDINSNGF